MPSQLSRRQVLALAGTSLASVAGCLSSEAATTTQATTEGQTTSGSTQDDPSSTPSDCPLPATESVTTHSNPPTPSGTGTLSSGLSVTSYYESPVSVILTEHESGATTYTHTYPAGQRFDVSAEMKDWLGYDVILRSGCEVLWEQRIGESAAYEITISTDGTIEVNSYMEA